jgi:hypothetical protein
VRNFRMLTCETIPCWYEISWRGRNGKPGILLRMHPDVVNSKNQIPPDARLALDFMQTFGFKRFSNTFEGDFGFENALKRVGVAKDGFLEYEIPTPVVKKKSKKICGMCNGTGRNQVLDGSCIFCVKGKEIYYDYHEAFAVSASLNLLLEFLSLFNGESNAHTPQLMSLVMVTMADAHGGSLGGEYSCELVDYLASRPLGEISEMGSAMRIVWRRMDGSLPRYRVHDFWARTQSPGTGWLNVNCSGDATGLNPSHGSDVNGRNGYKFACHNVDTPMQQLVLIASLAALHDLARKALVGLVR